VASLLLPALTRRMAVGRITLIGLFAHLAMLIAVALAPNLWAGIVLIGVWDLCNTLIVINYPYASRAPATRSQSHHLGVCRARGSGDDRRSH
jgi:hypothetical protein